MHSALHKGLVDPEETESLINFECATGNCTFGDFDHGEYFSSLASCYSCSNITDQVVPHALDVYTLPSGISVGGLNSGIREMLSVMEINTDYMATTTFF